LNEICFLASQLTANLPNTFLKPTSHYLLQPVRAEELHLLYHTLLNDIPTLPVFYQRRCVLQNILVWN